MLRQARIVVSALAATLGAAGFVSVTTDQAFAACAEAPAGTYTCTGSNSTILINETGPVTVSIGNAVTDQNATFSGPLQIASDGAITVNAAQTSASSSFDGAGRGIIILQSDSAENISVTGINTPINVRDGGISVLASTTGTTIIETVKGGTIVSGNFGISYQSRHWNAGDATITVGDTITTTGTGVNMDVAVGSGSNTVNINANVVGGIAIGSWTGRGAGKAIINIASGTTVAGNSSSTAVIWLAGVVQGTINNSGTISAVGSQRAVSFGENASSSTSTVFNNTSGARVSADPAGLAFVAGGQSPYSLTINNEVGAIVVGGVSVGRWSTVTINNAGTWTVNAAGDVYGQLTLNNSGTVTVDAGSALSANGGYAQSAGATTVNGTLSADIVLNGGTLGGSGKVIGNVSVGAGATVAPGNSVGPLSITGNASFASGSTYRVEIQGANADLLTIGGTATLAGTMQLVAGGGSYTFYTPYTVLTASGGVSGTFDTITTEGSFGVGVAAEVSYTTDSVQVKLNPGSLFGATMAAGPGGSNALSLNGISLAVAMDRAVANGADPSFLYPIYSTRDVRALNEALKTLSGEVHSVTAGLGLSAASGFLQAALDPFAAGRDPVAMPNTAGAVATSDAYASAGPAGAAPSRDANVAGRFTPDRRYAAWGQIIGSASRRDGDRHLGTSNSNSSGGHVALGIDLLISPEAVVGFGIAAGEARASLTNRLGDAKADIFQAGVYGMTRIDAFSLGAALGYASADTETTRAIPLLGAFAIKGKYRSDIWSGRIESSYRLLNVGDLAVSPYTAFTAQHIRTPGFTERDGATGLPTGLIVNSRSDTIMRTELGLRLDASTILFGQSATAFGKLGWGYYARGDNRFSASLVGLLGSTFAFQGTRSDRNTALLSTGLDIRLGPAATLGARFDGELSQNTQAYAGSATFKIRF